MDNDKKDDVVYLHLDDIIPNRFQPREVFDERALKELAISIREHGVIQPIIVRSVNGKYEIIAGERRYKASALAGLTTIPAIVKNLDDKETSKVALLENLQRKNLNAIEEARTYQKILELDEMTQEELAKTMGKSQSAVANKIRLLSLPDEIQEAVLKEKISERHARAILNIPDTEAQKEMLETVISERMPVRKLEKVIKEKYPKEKEEESINEIVDIKNEKVEIPKSEVEASNKDFVNENPIAPTTNVEEDSNYGKIVVAPPEGEAVGDGEEPNFINFGEIDKDEELRDDGNIQAEVPDVRINPDIEEITNNTEDINGESKEKSGSNLDSLLNIESSNNDVPEANFVTPAEGIVKTDIATEEEKDQDYFEKPDLSQIDLPSEVTTTDEEDTPQEETEKVDAEEDENMEEEIENSGKYTIQTAVEKARKLVQTFNDHELPADIEEMNFNKSYQIIIKIEKTDE